MNWETYKPYHSAEDLLKAKIPRLWSTVCRHGGGVHMLRKLWLGPLPCAESTMVQNQKARFLREILLNSKVVLPS